MTEKQEDSENARQPPSPDAGAEAPARPEQPSRTPLVEWQGPVFWMSCGALLAGLVAGAVVLAQRVGVERDLMAVATTLPPADSKPHTAPAPETAARGPERVAQAPVDTGRPGASVLEGPTAQDVPPRKAATARRHGVRTASVVPVRSQQHATARKPMGKKSAERRKASAGTDRYSEVFKRCPWPGEPGSVECRRHICNGAESEGPACKPYRSKLR